VKAGELRELSAPLKERCRAEPEAALVTLLAQGRLGDESLSRRDETGRALVEAGLHLATGGYGLSACSGDMLLAALVACAGVTLRAVATALDIELSIWRNGWPGSAFRTQRSTCGIKLLAADSLPCSWSSAFRQWAPGRYGSRKTKTRSSFPFRREKAYSNQ
jgi:hypothetical protein